MERLRLRNISDVLIISGLILAARPVAEVLINPSQEPPAIVQSLQEDFICSSGILGICTSAAPNAIIRKEPEKISDYQDLLYLGGGLTAVSVGLGLRQKEMKK